MVIAREALRGNWTFAATSAYNFPATSLRSTQSTQQDLLDLKMRARRESFGDEIPPTATVFEPKETSHLDALDDEHANIFKTALSRLLATELAEHTFAEIVDGLPTKASFRNSTTISTQ